MANILNIKLKNYTRLIIKLLCIVIIGLVLISAFILAKYKPVYKVTLLGEEVGYISNKKEFDRLVDTEILNPDEKNVAFVEVEEMPKFYFLFIQNNNETSEQEIFTKIKEMAVTTYKMYAVTLNNEVATYVDTKEEAEEIITKMKEENENKLEEINIAMQETFTQDKEETNNILEITSAIETAKVRLDEKVQKQKEIKAATFEGVYFAVRPVSGTITSRFGDVEDIRDHAHKGMDIAAPNGTSIKAAADGTITYSGWMSGYGNLIIISHGNGIQTYYGHCSKLYKSEGEEVEAGDVIAAVGSTGFSTGNHLHFEIRKNGAQINPQKYLYK